MIEYVVIRKSDQKEVHRYTHSEPVEWAGMEFVTHDHIAQEPAPVVPPPPSWEVLDVIDYLKLITPAERIAIRERARTDPVVEDIVDLQRNTSRIRSDDPDLLAALDYLTAVGILAPGRKQEILIG